MGAALGRWKESVEGQENSRKSRGMEKTHMLYGQEAGKGFTTQEDERQRSRVVRSVVPGGLTAVTPGSAMS